MTTSTRGIMKIEGLQLRFYTYEGVVEALDGVNVQIEPGEILGLVGETGCGKSVTSLAVMGLVPNPGVVEGGKILYNYDGKPLDLLKQKEEELRKMRGKEISMVFQEPRVYLNPVYTVEYQIGEVLLQHRKSEFIKRALDDLKKEYSKKLAEKREKLEKQLTEKIEELKAKSEEEHQKEIDGLTRRIREIKQKPPKGGFLVLRFYIKIYERLWRNPNSRSVKILSKIPIVRRFQRRLKLEVRKEVVGILKDMQIADPDRVVQMYPHELSGGMAQRVLIAMALACNPKLLICDEPTTNLDVTVQAQILELIGVLRKHFKSSILYITHDLGVIAQLCERVAIMYAGNVVELSDVATVFKEPLHPYTKGLLDSIPKPGGEFKSIPGIVPSLISPPEGCRFHTRCQYAMPICENTKPKFLEAKDNHFVACHLYDGGSKE